MSDAELHGEDERDVDDYADIGEIAIEAPDEEMEVLAEIELDVPEAEESGARLIALTRGNHERDDTSRRIEVKAADDEDITVYITPDKFSALGLFIQTLEQHGLDEEVAMESLRDPELNFDIDEYLAWRDEITQDERREMLLDDGEGRRERSPHVDRYLNEGSFRTVAETDVVRTVGQKLYDGIDANPRRCYRNSIVALNALEESEHVQYVEGLALPKQAGRAVAHAWLEVRGNVVELTWPWHAPIPPQETVYYGVPIDTETVLETTRRRNIGFNPILLKDEELLDA